MDMKIRPKLFGAALVVSALTLGACSTTSSISSNATPSSSASQPVVNNNAAATTSGAGQNTSSPSTSSTSATSTTVVQLSQSVAPAISQSALSTIDSQLNSLDNTVSQGNTDLSSAGGSN